MAAHPVLAAITVTAVNRPPGEHASLSDPVIRSKGFGGVRIRYDSSMGCLLTGDVMQAAIEQAQAEARAVKARPRARAARRRRQVQSKPAAEASIKDPAPAADPERAASLRPRRGAKRPRVDSDGANSDAVWEMVFEGFTERGCCQ